MVSPLRVCGRGREVARVRSPSHGAAVRRGYGDGWSDRRYGVCRMAGFTSARRVVPGRGGRSRRGWSRRRPRGFQGGLLGLGRTGGTGDDRAGVAHRPALGGGEAGDVSDDGFGDVRRDVGGGALFGVSADLPYEDDEFGVGIRLDGDEVDQGMIAAEEDLAALRRIVAVQADDQGLRQADGVQGMDDALGDRVARGDSAEHVDVDGADRRVGEDDGEAAGHHPGRGAAADVEEVGGAGSAACDHVEGGHDQAGPVADDADFPVQLDVVQALGAGHRLDRVAVREGEPGRGPYGLPVRAHGQPAGADHARCAGRPPRPAAVGAAGLRPHRRAPCRRAVLPRRGVGRRAGGRGPAQRRGQDRRPGAAGRPSACAAIP